MEVAISETAIEQGEEASGSSALQGRLLGVLGLLGDIYCAIFLKNYTITVMCIVWREITCNNECERRRLLTLSDHDSFVPQPSDRQRVRPATGPFPPRDRLRCVSSSSASLPRTGYLLESTGYVQRGEGAHVRQHSAGSDFEVLPAYDAQTARDQVAEDLGRRGSSTDRQGPLKPKYVLLEMFPYPSGTTSTWAPAHRPTTSARRHGLARPISPSCTVTCCTP